MFYQQLRKLFQKFTGKVLEGRPNRRSSIGLSLECLEDRCVPSTFIWKRGDNDPADWTRQGNWEKIGNDNGNYPGHMFNEDIAIFNNTSSNSCTLNVANGITVKQMAITDVYSGVITLNTDLNVQKVGPLDGFSMGAGILDGPGILNVEGHFFWTGGVMRGSGRTEIGVLGPEAEISENGKTLDTRELRVYRNTAWKGGDIVLNNGANIIVSNNRGGNPVFSASADSMTIRTATGTVGILRISNGTSLEVKKANPNADPPTISIQAHLDNLGIVNVDSGNLLLEGSSFTAGDGTLQTTTGKFNIAEAYTVTFKTGTHSLNGAEIAGVGQAVFESGTITLNWTVNVYNVEQSADVIGNFGANNLNIFGNYNWRQGAMRGFGKSSVEVGGKLTINAGLTVTLGRRLECNNGAEIVWGNGDIRVEGTEVPIAINGGSIFDIRGNSRIYAAAGASGTFTSAVNSIVKKTAGNGTARIQLPFTNNANWDIQIGSLEMGVGFVVVSGLIDINGGNLIAAAGITQTDGTIQVATGSLFAVSGNFDFNGGTTNLSGILTVDGSIVQTGGTFTNNGSMTVTANFTKSEGTFDLQASGVLAVTGTFTHSGGTSTIAGDLDVDGAFTHTAGTMDVAAGGSLDVTGIFDLSDGSVALNGGTLNVDSLTQAGGTLTDNGTMTVSADYTKSEGTFDLQASGVLTVTGAFTHSGGTSTIAGDLDVDGAFTHSAGTMDVTNPTGLEVASLTQSGGDLHVMAAASSTFQVLGDYTMTGGSADFVYSSATISGQMLLDGGVMLFQNVPAITATGGINVGSGGRLNLDGGTLVGNLTNSGIVAMGAEASPLGGQVFTITGNYTQVGSTSRLIIDAGFSGNDRLTVTGTATLAGIFQLLFETGYEPGIGSGFTFLDYGSRSGTFDSYDRPTLSEGAWAEWYAANAFGMDIV